MTPMLTASDAIRTKQLFKLPPRQLLKRVLLGTGIALGAVAAGQYGYDYWTVGRHLESTDDAYVKADYTTVAPKVSGYIAEVLVADNQHVKAGQALARIDDRDFRAALDQSRADYEAAEAALRNIDAQIALQHSVIAQQQASIDAAEANVRFAREDFARFRDLLKTGFGTARRAQETRAALGARQGELDRARAARVAAERAVDVLLSERGKAEAQRDRSAAALRQAKLNLSYTTIVAPVDGTVGARALRVGQYVQAGTRLMAVVPLHAVYVVANFKETQLTEVKKGQQVELSVDTFPDAILTGHVDSLSPASGLEFALLPPDNATGNFTKIVQRIPVRIAIDDDRLAGRLRAGMSVEATIDTRRPGRQA